MGGVDDEYEYKATGILGRLKKYSNKKSKKNCVT